jgi:hypothetical protein
MPAFPDQTTSPSAACKHTLTSALIAHGSGAQRAALLARAEERAAQRLRLLQFVDTRPALYRSEAFAEDLAEALPAPPMRGLAGVLGPHLAGMMMLGSALSAWTP